MSDSALVADGAPAAQAEQSARLVTGVGDPASAQTVPADWVVITLATTLFLAPALGVPFEEMIQDTLKSMIVSFGVLAAALVLFWHGRQQNEALRWHPVMGLPLMLMLYALGSMAWSHTYLAGVEAVRWFIFSLLLWLGVNRFNRQNFPVLASAIHWGAVVASLWVMLQFLVDFQFFPQGPNPASTFVNRNFFAEFVVSTLPFSVWFVLSARGPAQIALRSFFVAFNLVAVMMTGTRSALLALAVLLLLLPLVLRRFRAQLESANWSRADWRMAWVIFAVSLVALGSVPTGNPNLRKEERGNSALQRTFQRAASLSATDEFTTGSSGVRLVLWKSTLQMVQARPLTGVGAGAWEADVPLYQLPGAQLETDFYAHNEYLQLLAEYGAVGWIFLLLLLIYLARAVWTTVLNSTQNPASPDGLIRAVALMSLPALLLVSAVGFPWRLASTGALFAVALALLAATDSRGHESQSGESPARESRAAWFGRLDSTSFAVDSRAATAGLLAVGACLLLAVYISVQAARAEFNIVRATKLALTISASGDVNNPKWNGTKERIVALLQEGIAINPHYRKITPMVADEFARWGDWKTAIWIWQSVLASRPHVVAMLTNIARGYSNQGDMATAFDYVERARKIAPQASSVASVEAVLLSQSGQDDKAKTMMRQALASGIFDLDMVNAAFNLGSRQHDWPLAIEAMTLRAKRWPKQAVQPWLRVGNIQLNELKDEAQALVAYRAAVAAAPPLYREEIRQNVPESLRGRL